MIQSPTQLPYSSITQVITTQFQLCQVVFDSENSGKIPTASSCELAAPQPAGDRKEEKSNYCKPDLSTEVKT